MSRTLLHSLWILACCLTLAAWGYAQGTAKSDGNAPLPQGATPKPAAPAPVLPRNARKITITEEVRPAFVIDPIVNKVETRPGRIVLAEFGITCDSRPSKLEIEPVALTQDENGTIFANTKAPAPEELEIITPLAVDLTPGEKFVIRTRIRVPPTQSTFHTFGILVRDAGQLTPKSNAPKSDGPRLGIRFVTQYLLRCDITVQGVKAESAAKLKVESAELVEVDGVPHARVYVSNPTDGPIEFGMRTQIRRSEESENRPTFPLWMPVRANSNEPEKYVGRILSGARVRMVSPLDSPIFPGQYYMESSILGGNRVLAKTGFPIVVEEGDFPALGIATVEASHGIQVSPAQVELSLQRGGSRAQVVTLENTGSVATEVELVSQTMDGAAADWIAIRPSKLTLLPGTTRKTSISLSSTGDLNTHRYSRLQIKSTPAEGSPQDSTPVVVAALGRAPLPKTELSAQQMEWDDQAARPSFVVAVSNRGTVHVPIEGMLVLGDESAKPYEVRGGFGKWILPGTTEQIRFKVPKNLPPGHYTARLRIPTGTGSDPIDQKLELDLGQTGETPQE